MQKLILASLCFTLLTQAAFSQLYSPRRTTGSYYAMGGAYTAYFDHDLYAYYNPAALTKLKKEASEKNRGFSSGNIYSRESRLHIVQVAGLQIGAGSDLYDKVDDVMQLVDYFSDENGSLVSERWQLILDNLGLGQYTKVEDEYSFNFDELVTNSEASDHFFSLIDTVANSQINSSLALELFQYSTKNFSTGLDILPENTVNLSMENAIAPGLPFPQVSIKMAILYYLSFAFPMRSAYDQSLGFTIKAFNQLEITAENDSQLGYLIENSESLVGELSADAAALAKGGAEFSNQSLAQYSGVGVDLGYLLQFRPNMYIGAFYHDAYTQLFYTENDQKRADGSLDVGYSYQMPVHVIGLVNEPWLSLGYNDLFHQRGGEWFQHLGMGMSFNTLLDLFDVNLGLYHGYTSFSLHREFNIGFLSRYPFFRFFFPARKVSPLWFPRQLNQAGFREYVRKNPIMYLGSSVMRLLTKVNMDFYFGLYTLERSLQAGAQPQRNLELQLQSELRF